MNMISSSALLQDSAYSGQTKREKQGLVFIVGDDPDCFEKIAPICDFLDLDVQIIAAGNDLLTMLRARRPMAVISDLDGIEQDGFHTMKVIAGFNRDLPVMLLTQGDPIMMGAADAVRELWGLRSVTLTNGSPAAGQVVAFLFTAGRAVGCMRLVPV